MEKLIINKILEIINGLKYLELIDDIKYNKLTRIYNNLNNYNYNNYINRFFIKKNNIGIKTNFYIDNNCITFDIFEYDKIIIINYNKKKIEINCNFYEYDYIINKINKIYDIYKLYEIYENQKNKKINQCIAICNTLIKNNFRRPFNLTEDIMNCY